MNGENKAVGPELLVGVEGSAPPLAVEALPNPTPEAVQPPVAAPSVPVQAVQGDDLSVSLDEIEESPSFEGLSDEEVRDLKEAAPVEEVIKTGVVEFATSKPRKEGGSPDHLFIPPDTPDVVNRHLEEAPSIDLTVSAKQSRWAAALVNSDNRVPSHDFYPGRLKVGEWKQSIAYRGESLMAKQPVITANPGTTEIDGEKAILNLVSALGIGGLHWAPMWHSGFWVMFMPASEEELIDLNNLLAANEIEYSRLSYGMPLSSAGVHAVDTIFQFALEHVYQTSVIPGEMSTADIRKHLRPQDLWPFIWGYLCATYPNGFHYTTPCINNPEKCNYVAEETLNLHFLLRTDDTSITEEMRAHMSSKRPKSMKLEDVLRYQRNCQLLKPKRVKILDGERGVALTFKSCTLTEMIGESAGFVSEVVSAFTTAVGQEPDPAARNQYVNARVRAAYLTQYVHWVESIEIGDMRENAVGSNAVAITTDRATLARQLARLSSIDSVRERIVEEVKTYIGETTLALVAVNSFDCPVCKASQDNTKYPHLAKLIPLDMISVFFDLLIQRLSRIGERD